MVPWSQISVSQMKIKPSFVLLVYCICVIFSQTVSRLGGYLSGEPLVEIPSHWRWCLYFCQRPEYKITGGSSCCCPTHLELRFSPEGTVVWHCNSESSYLLCSFVPPSSFYSDMQLERYLPYVDIRYLTWPKPMLVIEPKAKTSYRNTDQKGQS